MDLFVYLNSIERVTDLLVGVDLKIPTLSVVLLSPSIGDGMEYNIVEI